MMEQITKLMIAGTLGSGVAMLATSVVTTATTVAQVAEQTPDGESTASTMSKLVDARPELAAVLLVVSMFLAYLVALNRDQKKDAAAATVSREAKEKEDRVRADEDRAFRERMAADCHRTSMEHHDKSAQVTQAALVNSEKLAAVTREAAVDRNIVLKALQENTTSNQELRDAFNRMGSQGT